MAKDPAILWYWNDWHGGTVTFTRHLKGCYMDLLHAQFNNGRLSIFEVKTVLGNDFGPVWPVLLKKFKKDENDNYYNEKMESEKIKRETFQKKQSVNGNLGGRPKKTQTKPKQNPNVNPNETLLENEDEIKDDIEDLLLESPENLSFAPVKKEDPERVIEEILNSESWIILTAKTVNMPLQTVKDKLIEFLGKLKLSNELERGQAEVQRHFVYWLYKKNEENAGKSTITDSPKQSNFDKFQAEYDKRYPTIPQPGVG